MICSEIVFLHPTRIQSGDSLTGELTHVPGNNVGSYAITKGTLTAGRNPIRPAASDGATSLLGNYDVTGTLDLQVRQEENRRLAGHCRQPCSRHELRLAKR